MSGLSLFLDTFFRLDLVERYWLDVVFSMIVTIKVAVAVIFTGLAVGFALALIRSFGIRPVNVIIVIFSDVNRALPPLVLILLAYFGLPSLGIGLSNITVLWLVLSCVLAAFSEEIFWAGILSIRKGQWEAARSTGLTYFQALAWVVLPQALRLTVPSLTNRTIVIIKNTALGTVIGVPEILNVSSTAESFVGNMTPLTLGVIAFLILFVPILALGRWIETRFKWTRA